MNKRMAKKSRNKLSNDEKIVLELFKKCERVDFFIYDSTVKNGVKFVELLETKAKFDVVETAEDTTSWLQTEKGKIEVTAFLK